MTRAEKIDRRAGIEEAAKRCDLFAYYNEGMKAAENVGAFRSGRHLAAEIRALAAASATPTATRCDAAPNPVGPSLPTPWPSSGAPTKEETKPAAGARREEGEGS